MLTAEEQGSPGYGTERGGPDKTRGAVSDVPDRYVVPGYRAGRGAPAGTARLRCRLSDGRDLLRANALQHRLPGPRAAARRGDGQRFSWLRRGDRAVRLVRRHG